jgi:hypothetical protein
MGVFMRSVVSSDDGGDTISITKNWLPRVVAHTFIAQFVGPPMTR